MFFLYLLYIQTHTYSLFRSTGESRLSHVTSHFFARPHFVSTCLYLPLLERHSGEHVLFGWHADTRRRRAANLVRANRQNPRRPNPLKVRPESRLDDLDIVVITHHLPFTRHRVVMSSWHRIDRTQLPQR